MFGFSAASNKMCLKKGGFMARIGGQLGGLGKSGVTGAA